MLKTDYGNFMRLDAKRLNALYVNITDTTSVKTFSTAVTIGYGSASFSSAVTMASSVSVTGKMMLNTTVYNNIYLGCAMLRSTGSTAYILKDLSTAHATILGNQAIQFDGTTSQSAGFSVMLPKDYKAGTLLTPYIVYGSTSSTSSTQAFVMGLCYTMTTKAQASTAFAKAVSQEITLMGSSAAYENYTTYFSDIGSTNLVTGSLINGALYRNSTVATNTYTTMVYVYGLGFLYQTDGFGSTYNTITGK